VGTVITRVDTATETAQPKLRLRAKCQGAMSQQGYGAHGNESYPQKLVQLVGHRDPDAYLEAWGPRSKRVAGSAT
jgi:hypothetical protein